VLPDGCVDVVWRNDGTLFVAGPDRGPVAHRHAAGARFAGVRLRPGTAATTLGVAADELRDRQVPLSALWGRRAERLADRLHHAASPAECRRLLADAVAGAPAAVDDRVPAAVAALERAPRGVGDLAGEAGLGARQLRRRFVAQVGYGPKTYARIVRLRRFLALARAGDGLAELAYAAGYADQAHLTRECRRLTGRTPAQLRGDRNVQDRAGAAPSPSAP